MLLTMTWGIGDTIAVGLSAVDQITRNDPGGHIKIEVLCNHPQAELLEHDPRISRLIQFDDSLFPTPEAGTWKRGIVLPASTKKLAAFLRDQHYTAVLPFMFAPTFFYQLHTPVMFLSPRELWHVIAVLRNYGEMHMQTLIREIINKHFGWKLPEPSGDEAIPLYICQEHMQKAMQKLACIKGQTFVPDTQSKVLLVAPDTSSPITRPPISLLTEGIAGSLKSHADLIVALLPSYADKQASPNLLHNLASRFPGRVVLLPAEPKMPLPELAAFIDQCDLLLSGDTGIMHLAVAMKKIEHITSDEYSPRNTVKIITLFGGTHPGMFGYSKRALILGKWRKEQRAIRPGIVKEVYNPGGKNFFDHISPQQVTEAILSQVEQPITPQAASHTA
ncbi:MAG TPA: glycosyltransferase family 9 protein [Ktedonobacteraceae bacterium]|nr:glycosyltransferase family 9 protein [Ktedonobacteraceae bacterium]